MPGAFGPAAMRQREGQTDADQAQRGGNQPHRAYQNGQNHLSPHPMAEKPFHP